MKRLSRLMFAAFITVLALSAYTIAATSNANYPQTGAIKRFLNPNSRFKGKAEVLPEDGKPVILIYAPVKK
ncbi:hypothetical protein [Dissulfurispira sp.]|uniref:hypothetical protein n=1 Tax=Dissulfurispira sp. TaxID=2817609 RepID=UPI002FD8E2F1